MKNFNLIVFNQTANSNTYFLNFKAKNIKDLFSKFNKNKKKGCRIAYIENATLEEMSELRALEQKGFY